jgi:aldose 1-epimerase
LAIALAMGSLRRWPVAALLTLWPTYGGHRVEVGFLNFLRPSLMKLRPVQMLARLLVWFAGGLLLTVGMHLAAIAIGAPPLRGNAWWIAGPAFIVVKLIAHVPLQLLGRSSFYNDRGYTVPLYHLHFPTRPADAIVVPMATRLHMAIVTLFLATFAHAQTAAPAAMKRVEESNFGTMSDSGIVKLYTLTNAKGMQARVLSFGGLITGIKAPDKSGAFTNVVAGPDAWEQTQRFGMAAQTIGRVANRIAGAKFTLEGKEYTLQANNGGNTLHGGNSNFGTKLWEGKVLPDKPNEGSVQLTYVSKDGDGGMPGTLTLKVIYTLTDEDEFRLDYEATTDKTTVVNFTNHAYFNLSGATGWGNATATPVADHELWVDAEKYVVMNQTLIPTGEIVPVAGTAWDFTKPAAIGSRAPQRGYDHAFVLNSGGGELALVARLRGPKSGREMEGRTDQPGIQGYTGQRTRVALETQHHPDSIHHDIFPTTILKAGETFKTTTVYAFSAK